MMKKSKALIFALALVLVSTAAWSQGDRTYLLIGMKYSKFTQRFYKDRQWLMSI